MDNYSKNINVFLIVNYNDYENTFKLLKITILLMK